MTDEGWREIAGFPGYWINTTGQVWNSKTDRYLAGSYDHYGNHRVGLRRDGMLHVLHTSQLVARAFFDNHETGSRVRRITRNKDDNSVSNLRTTNGRPHGIVREGTGNRVVRRLRIVGTDKTFPNVRSLAQFLGIDISMVYKVLNGSRRSAAGHEFEYVDIAI